MLGTYLEVLEVCRPHQEEASLFLTFEKGWEVFLGPSVAEAPFFQSYAEVETCLCNPQVDFCHT